MSSRPAQLISYIAPAAPATRRPADGDEPLVRPEIGFTPRWYREALGIDFGRRWHTDVAYRRDTVRQMRAELRRRFPGTRIGGIHRPDAPLDLLTGTYGACAVAAIYGLPILYAADNWPTCPHRYLSGREAAEIEPPDLDGNPFFQELMAQVDRIAELEGRVEGFVNWQGVLNNAYRLRGEALLCDMVEDPPLARHIFECACTTMIDAARRLQARQRETGVDLRFGTAGNCMVNMISPEHYRRLLLPFDVRLAEAFGRLALHSCAWTADPYLEHYAAVPHVAYVDVGLHSDLRRVRELFPHARRAVMYTPMDVQRKPPAEIRADLERVARDYAPCDVVFADIEAGTTDARVEQLTRICRELSGGRIPSPADPKTG